MFGIPIEVPVTHIRKTVAVETGRQMTAYFKGFQDTSMKGMEKKT